MPQPEPPQHTAGDPWGESWHRAKHTQPKEQSLKDLLRLNSLYSLVSGLEGIRNSD